MSNKIKVSFEITDSWANEGFRNFIRLLLSDDTRFDVYILSNHDPSSEVVTVANTLGIESPNIILCNFNSDKAQAIIDNGIQIHLDNLQSFVLLVEETTDAYGILVTPYLNKFQLKADYAVVFDRVLARIENEQGC